MTDDWKPGTGRKICKLYAWIATEPDGGEGLVAAYVPGTGGWTPLIGADRARVESFRSHAEATVEATGATISLKVFDGGTVIDTIESAKR